MVRKEASLKVLVAVDGFAGGEDAVAAARTLAHGLFVDVRLLHVRPEPLVPMPLTLGPAEDGALVDEHLREVRDRMLPAARCSVVTDASAARALVHAAERWPADVVVLGSSRSAPPGVTRPGGTARQVLHGAPCATLIVPAGARETERDPSTIGVAWDGSPESGAALEWAGGIARVAGAQLDVIAVVDDRTGLAITVPFGGPPAPADVRPLLDAAVTDARAALDGLRDVLPGKSVTEVLIGAPVRQLAAASGRLDLLVIGSRRWGPLRRVVLGSTSDGLARSSECPLLITPRGAMVPRFARAPVATTVA